MDTPTPKPAPIIATTGMLIVFVPTLALLRAIPNRATFDRRLAEARGKVGECNTNCRCTVEPIVSDEAGA